MDIIGHGSIRKTLKRIAEAESGPQSFLFVGPRRVGKQLVAQEFAHRLIGEIEGTMRDLSIISPESESKDDKVREAKISIEAVREGEAFVALFPEHGRRRVLIIDDAHQLTLAAQNALLKLLEEPNSTSSIILVTHEPGRLLPTILSRLFPIPFQVVKKEEILSSLPSAQEVPDFFVSLGLPGLIIEAHEQPESFLSKKNLLKQLFQLSRLTWHERLRLAEELSQDEARTLDLIEIWLLGLRQNAEAAMVRGQASFYFQFLEAVLYTREKAMSKEGNIRLRLESLFALA